MKFQKFETFSFPVGGRHKSATIKIYSDITSKGSKVLIGFCSSFKKTSMTVSDNTNVGEAFGDFFKNLGKKGLNVLKKMAKNVLKTLEELWKLELTLVVHLLL